MKKKTFFNHLYRKARANVTKVSKRIIIPGFEGMPLYDVVNFFIRGIQKSSLISRANAVSFTFLLAIFPAILFFFTLIPYIPINNLRQIIMETLQNALPENAFITVKNTITEIISHHNGGLLSLGFFISIYFSTNGMMGIMKAFNRTSHTIETRSNFKLRLVSALLIVVLTILVIVAAFLLGSTSYFIRYLESTGYIEGTFVKFLIQAGKWLITFLLTFISISTIYYIAPASTKIFRFISAGSTLATLLSFIFIIGFNFYIDNFGQYNELYGSLGTLIIMMLWINLNSIVLLIGFELNASIYDAKIKLKNR